MKIKTCAYCDREFGNGLKRSAEHIFPQTLLDLYPEQDVSFTPERVFKDNKGLTIADVCNECNNGKLSELDNYGGNLIREQFYNEIDYALKDSFVTATFDYEMFSKWIIKISYNYLRSRKVECSFVEHYKTWILGELAVIPYFDIFLGFHMNMSPLSEECYNYQPLSIIENPKLLGMSLGISAMLELPIDINSVEVLKSYCQLSIRFGNLIIYIVFWQETAEDKLKKQYRSLLTKEFNFVRLEREKIQYQLKRVSASSNTSMGYAHFLSKSAMKQDEMLVEHTLQGRNVKEVRTNFEAQRTERDRKASRLLVEAQMFPKNNKVKKELEIFFDKKESNEEK